MEELDEDEDVIIEGSDLHRALVDMGYTDFECTSVNKNKVSEHSPESYKWIKRLCNVTTYLGSLKRIFGAPKACGLSMKQLATILKMESLLDDHAAVIHSILNKNSYSFWTKAREWSTLTASATILGVSYFMPETGKTSVVLFVSSIAAMALHRKYEDFRAIKCLQEVVCLQNELFYLSKKGLRVLRKGYQLRTDPKQAQTKFSKLEIDRLKYLQPVTETLLKSMENISRIYYHASSMLVKLLPESALFNIILSNFENDAFDTVGEITYSTLRHLYYVYILTQSDTMQLLAYAYDLDTWTKEGEIPHLQLARITCNLCRLLSSQKTQLARVIEKYENCKTRPVQRKYRGPAASKWRDLYLNLDLLLHKVHATYDTIGSILEEIDKRKDLTETDDDYIIELVPRINEIYKQIDTARNFAKFNNLLMAILQRSRRRAESPVTEETALVPDIECDLPIVRDSDPQIIDEVFEEYITEEYLKPIYDENDEAGMESAKLDKLLAKNFMSELKEALIDKYKSMSEREAKALLRKYCESNGHTNIAIETNSPVNRVCETSIIPHPPPLPELTTEEEKHPVLIATKQRIQFRPPVPLPRTSANARYRENASSESVTERFSIPSPQLRSQIDGAVNPEQRFSIDRPNRKIAAFVTFEEEFIGSGENSAEELEDSDCEEDRGYIHGQKLSNETTK